MNNKIKELLIRAAYGDVTFIEKIKVAFVIRKNTEAKTLYVSYRKTAIKVKKLKRGNLPSVVADKLEALASETTSSRQKAMFTISPGLAVAFSILLIALFTFTFLKKNTDYYGKYNKETVENATEETLASLKMVAQIFSQTKKIVVDNILVNKVSQPINNGLNQVEKIIK